jgi:hypothetical protein
MRDVGRSRPKTQFDQRADRRLRAQRKRVLETIEVREHLDEDEVDSASYWSLLPE